MKIEPSQNSFMVYWYDIIEYIGSENILLFLYLRFREKIVVLLSCIFALTVLEFT